MLSGQFQVEKEKNMNILKCGVGCAISATLMVACAPAYAATASEYPTRPIRIVVPQGAGGSTEFRRNRWMRNHKILERIHRGIDRAGEAKPGQLSFASSGVAAGPHVSAELFKHMAGIDMIHVPFKGAAPANNAVLAGEVQLVIASTVALLLHVRAGKLRGLAVTTSRRSPVAPDIPAVMESGLPKYEHNDWNGMFAPARTPRELIARVNAEVARILQMQDVVRLLPAAGIGDGGQFTEEFTAFIRSYTPKWEKVIKAAGITVN